MSDQSPTDGRRAENSTRSPPKSTPAPRPTRRRFLAAGAATTLTGLAGCLLFAGGEDLGLYAAAAADGSEQWTMELSDVEVSPTLLDGTVYVGLGETLHAVSPVDGSDLWTTEIDLPGFPGSSRPTKAGDVLLVPGDDELVGLSATDGAEQWRFEGDYEVWYDPPVADGVVVAGAGETDVDALSLSDGSQQWQFSGQDLEADSAAIAGDTVVVNSRAGRVHGRSLSDGSERWTYDTGDPAAGRPAVGDGAVYVGTTGRHVHAIDVADGSQQWRFDTSGDENNVAVGSESYPRPRVVDGRVYVHAENEILFVLDASGREQWRLNTDFELGYAVVDGTTYAAATRTESHGSSAVGSSDITHHPTVYALDGGDEQWETELDGKRVASPPGVGSDAVYVGLLEQGVHALARSDGSERWVYEPGVVEDRPMVAGDVVLLVARA